eukprot:899816-Pyramimonas_sp.AAC.1
MADSKRRRCEEPPAAAPGTPVAGTPPAAAEVPAAGAGAVEVPPAPVAGDGMRDQDRSGAFLPSSPAQVDLALGETQAVP